MAWLVISQLSTEARLDATNSPSIANQSTSQQSHVHTPLRSIVQRLRKGHGIRRGSGDSIKTGHAWAAQ